MTKQEWQASPQYHALKQRVLQAQHGCCADCGRRGALELHHLVYPYNKIVHGGPGWWGDEDDSDVVALCRACHHQRHRDRNGAFWADPREMQEHWNAFDEAMEKD